MEANPNSKQGNLSKLPNLPPLEIEVVTIILVELCSMEEKTGVQLCFQKYS